MNEKKNLTTKETFDLAKQMLNKAIQIQPEHAHAHNRLSLSNKWNN